jgi:hypothetical protein
LCSGVGSAILRGVERQRLKSNAILSAGYDPAAQELELEFRSGHVYRYENVPASVFAWLLRTENKGGYVRRMITGQYVERAVHAVREAGEGSVSLEDALRASLERATKPKA